MEIRYAKSVRFSTDDNVIGVTISWPDPLSLPELEDLRNFIAIWMRGVERRAKKSGWEAAIPAVSDGIEGPASPHDAATCPVADCPDCALSAPAHGEKS